jgi:hypothetical protein
MQNEFLSTLSAYSKNSVDSAKSLVELNGTFLNKILESQVALANLYVEGSEKQMEVATGTSDPKEFISKQTALVEEYSAKLADFAQANTKLAEEASEKLKEWVEDGVKLAEASAKK